MHSLSMACINIPTHFHYTHTHTHHIEYTSQITATISVIKALYRSKMKFNRAQSGSHECIDTCCSLNLMVSSHYVKSISPAETKEYLV